LSQMLVIGHRGCPSRFPENTLPSFLEAVRQGADGVELDVHLTKDGRLVVMHDYLVDRTTDGHGRLSLMTMREVLSLDAGRKFGLPGTRVPTLEDVLEQVGDVLYLVEIKRGSALYPGIEEKVVDAIRKKRRRAIVISFDFDSLIRVRQLDQDLQTGIIVVGRPYYFTGLAREVGASWVSAPLDLVEEGDGDRVRSSGVAFMLWSPSTDEDVLKAMKASPDALISNDPGLVRRLMKELA